MRADLEESFRDLRPYAFAIAYRMLGSVADAEDVVQDVFLRFGQASEEEIRSPKAFLATATTRRAIDALRSARAQRESYVGSWLPEPLLDEQPPGARRLPGADVATVVETADSLSMAFLVVLETLNPLERAVFLLHDVFGYGYDEIGDIVDRSEPACRQLASRARRRVHEATPRFEASQQQRHRLAERFLAAAGGQDIDGLVELLAADAVLYGDGGTTGAGINRPVYGRENVATMFAAWFRQAARLGIRAVATQVNGQPGARMLDVDGRLVNVISLDIADGTVQTVRSVINPDKLAHLGPLSPHGRRRPG